MVANMTSWPLRIWLASILMVGGCGERADDPPEVVLPAYAEPAPEPSATFAPVAYPTSVVRSHNYDEAEETTYYYIAAVSEEERKQGKGAGSVSGFRYLGRNSDGNHILAAVSDSGAVSRYARWPDKCVVIHFSDGDHMAYNNGSIIGAAFEDAIKGRLRRWIAPRPQEPVYYDPPEAAQAPLSDPPSSSPALTMPGETPLPTESPPAGE